MGDERVGLRKSHIVVEVMGLEKNQTNGLAKTVARSQDISGDMNMC